jgi:predicted transcriptional regulator
MKAASVKIPTTLALSPELRETLDAVAARQDRSRSWVVTQALREYVGRECGGATQSAEAASMRPILPHVAEAAA